MGDVMTRAADAGSLRMSRAKLPFAEAKSCEDVECTFCPCGALRCAPARAAAVESPPP